MFKGLICFVLLLGLWTLNSNISNSINSSGQGEKANANWYVGCFVIDCDIKSTSNLNLRIPEFVNTVIFKIFSPTAQATLCILITKHKGWMLFRIKTIFDLDGRAESARQSVGKNYI